MKLTSEQYERTISDPVAFHKYILSEPFKLSDPQAEIMRAIGSHLETTLIAGSKSGKSTMSAEISLWGVYRMLQFGEGMHAKYGLTPGMKIFSMNIAPKTELAVDIILQYIIGLAQRSWYLSETIDTIKYNEVQFINGITARAQGSSSKAGRGYAIFNLVLDECAAFMDTRGNMSGTQVLNAYAPRLTPFGEDGRLVMITTPQGRAGIAYESFRTGKPIRVMQQEQSHNQQPFRAVFQYATWELNPLPQYSRDSPFMIKERKRDPWWFDREYGALFADVVSAFLEEKAIDDCVDNDYIVPPVDKVNNYVITGDPGFEHDNYAIAMGHVGSEGHVVVDLIRRFEPPLNIIEIENFYEELYRKYRVVDIVLDKHLSMATIQRLYDKGLPVRGLAFGTKTDVRIYQNLLELVNVQGIKFVKTRQREDLLVELKRLQRVVLEDRYRVQASPGAHDDLADAVAMLSYALKVEKISGGVVLF